MAQMGPEGVAAMMGEAATMGEEDDEDEEEDDDDGDGDGDSEAEDGGGGNESDDNRIEEIDVQG